MRTRLLASPVDVLVETGRTECSTGEGERERSQEIKGRGIQHRELLEENADAGLHRRAAVMAGLAAVIYGSDSFESPRESVNELDVLIRRVKKRSIVR
jgi:hypothetical protein